MFNNVHLETTYIALWEENYKIIKFRLNKANIGIGLMLFLKRLCRFIVLDIYSIVIQLKKTIREIRY
jgi:hypothetical protein